MCYTLFVEGKLMHDAGMFDTMNSVEAVFNGVYIGNFRANFKFLSGWFKPLEWLQKSSVTVKDLFMLYSSQFNQNWKLHNLAWKLIYWKCINKTEAYRRAGSHVQSTRPVKLTHSPIVSYVGMYMMCDTLECLKCQYNHDITDVYFNQERYCMRFFCGYMSLACDTTILSYTHITITCSLYGWPWW